MADFRRQTGLQIAAGQSMGALYRFKELLVQQAVDIIQPNVVNCGGYTGGLRVADMALGFGRRSATAAARPSTICICRPAR